MLDHQEVVIEVAFQVIAVEADTIQVTEVEVAVEIIIKVIVEDIIIIIIIEEVMVAHHRTYVEPIVLSLHSSNRVSFFRIILVDFKTTTTIITVVTIKWVVVDTIIKV